jgi:aryl-alcohol dehydrogenase-like predicted oxidoreductase
MDSYLSKIGLGTVQFGLDYGISNEIGQTSLDEVKLILNHAKKVGINTIDTASAYGTSEEVLGKNLLDDFKIITKFLLNHENQSLEKQFETSLNKLNRNTIYGYIAHRPSNIIENPKNWNLLNKWKLEGLIQKVGFSFNEVSEIKAVLDNGFIPDLIQVPYNYFDNRFEKFMIELKNKGCEIHTRSTFLQGLFFADTELLPPFFKEVIPRIVKLQNEYKELPGALLKYSLEKPFIDKVIIGINNFSQLNENIKFLNTENILPKKNFKIPENILIPSKWEK